MHITKEMFDAIEDQVLDECERLTSEFYASEYAIVSDAFLRVKNILFMDDNEKAERAELARLLEKYSN